MKANNANQASKKVCLSKLEDITDMLKFSNFFEQSFAASKLW